MPTAAFTTLGCKVNQYETQKILESFEAAGFRVVPFEGPADVYLINSCSVTSQAEAKSRYTIRRAGRFNPDAKVVVTGCASQMAAIRGEAVEGADVTVPNPEKLSALDHLLRRYPEVLAKVESGEPATPHPVAPSGRTRATLKIQDGCSVHCSYCSIPFTRPGMVSRPYLEVLDEAERLVAMGFREVVLTGVLIGAYGRQTGSGGPDFEDLVALLAERIEETGIECRIRISSIETTQVTPRLISLLREGWVVPHLHIPLQSGDTQVLRDMNRPYSQADYLELCERLYREVPGISLTTDIMVGFPTETEDRFESSLEVCRQVGFLKAHMFRFSPRHGTPADRLGDPVSPEEKQRRASALASLTAETGRVHARRFLGRALRVLAEGKIGKDGMLEGHTDNYLSARFPGSPTLARRFVRVRLDAEEHGVILGEVQPDSLRV